MNLGTPNACTRCHLQDESLPLGTSEDNQVPAPDRPDFKQYGDWLLAARRGDDAVQAHLTRLDRWADRVLDIWYGKTRKKEPHFAEALHAAREMLPDAAPKLRELLLDRNQPAVARATAALELAPFVEPGNAALQALRASLADRDPQVRSAAVLGLQQDSSNETISAIVPLLNDPTRLLRTEAARTIALMGPDPNSDDPRPALGPDRLRGDEREAFRKAIDECFDAASVDDDRAAGHMNLAVLYENLGLMDKAEEAYQLALRVEPGSVGPRSNLAELYDQRVQAAQHSAMQLAQTGIARRR